jgi:hypothetical protein
MRVSEFVEFLLGEEIRYRTIFNDLYHNGARPRNGLKNRIKLLYYFLK